MCDEALRKQQIIWQQLFKKQKSQGGIIDVEAERQKYRLPPVQSVNLTDNAEQEATLHPVSDPSSVSHDLMQYSLVVLYRKLT